MKFEEPENNNYVATVVKIDKIIKLEGCDNVVGAPIFGFQSIVGKNTQVGDIGLVFTAETQLSEEFVRHNNLYRHSELNADHDQTGYLEDNRRVKAMKFRGHTSNALFMPLSSLAFTGIDVNELKVGDIFDKINSHEVCKKYLRKIPVSRLEKNKVKVFRRVDEKFLPEHYDSEQYDRNKHVIKGNKQIIVTQKLHGTSIRIGNTIVKRQLNLRDRMAKKLGVNVLEQEFAHVYGSRKAIKDPNNPAQNHFYESDIWTEEGKKLDDLVPDNFILYGELIGWTSNGAPIQKNYTYRVPHGTSDLYIYRVAMVSNQGILVDLSWEQVKEFCNDRALKYVPELWVGMHRYFNAEEWKDRRFADDGIKNAVPLDDNSPCDEGVCIRVDGLAPYILKAKSPRFFEHESKMLDEEAVDIEEDSKQDTA